MYTTVLSHTYMHEFPKTKLHLIVVQQHQTRETNENLQLESIEIINI